jgi:hypothetical protein
MRDITGMCLYGICTPSIATNAPPWTRSSWSVSPAGLTFGTNQTVHISKHEHDVFKIEQDTSSNDTDIKICVTYVREPWPKKVRRYDSNLHTTNWHANRKNHSHHLHPETCITLYIILPNRITSFKQTRRSKRLIRLDHTYQTCQLEQQLFPEATETTGKKIK